ncbi:MAG: hypothetical protein RL095_2771 [Verrucomicrobiota bacterium]|jgi:molecular chaperone DnaK (HSP70)
MRFIVGIDLGTTNSAISYADLNSPEPGRIHILPLPQSTARGEVDKRPGLPSFAFLPPLSERDSCPLPWGEQAVICGLWAREHGAALPERLVSSAKSWLTHNGVDRSARILPWGEELEDADKLSPVEASALYLGHIRAAWDAAFSGVKDAEGSPCRLAEQQVLLTVPASFDEVARELTVEAARKAGLPHPVLLEEPLAAFCAWLAHAPDWQEQLPPGKRALVVDIGGGTSDFTLIDHAEAGTLRRSAVGSHLLLGGDNIDLAIANLAQERFGRKLSRRQLAQLGARARTAKERLLAADAPDKFDLVIQGEGSSLVGGSLRASLGRDEVRQLVLEGFFPLLALDAPGPARRQGLRDLGLPYERETAVTRQLLAFLRGANPAQDGSPLLPDRVLFNGGSLTPELLRQRLSQALAEWSGAPVPELPARDLDLAVALGATAHGLARKGIGPRVQGGIARAYFIALETSSGRDFACILPRDTAEGVTCTPELPLAVRANEPVSFLLAASETRLGDGLGVRIGSAEDLSLLPPLRTVVAFGKAEKREVQVRLSATTNEIGTLDLWLEAPASGHRWKLAFDLRAVHQGSAAAPTQQSAAVPQNAIEAAITALHSALGPEGSSGRCQGLMKELEAALGLPRGDWPLPLLRQLADALIELLPHFASDAAREARGLNLLGWCLRPGFGDPGDDLRLRRLWTRWHSGSSFPKDAQAASEWWTLWRRCSGGLKRGQQEQMQHAIVRRLYEGSSWRPDPKAPEQERRELIRCLGSLELMPVTAKARHAAALACRSPKLDEGELWTLGRLLSRRLAYGPADLVLPAAAASAALRLLLDAPVKKQAQPFAFCLLRGAGLRGDAALDLPEPLRDEIRQVLSSLGQNEAQLEHLHLVKEDSRDESKQLFGDELPLGLKLSEG